MVAVKSLGILLPAINEARCIGEVIKAIPMQELLADGYKPTIIVADGGSMDGTADVARNLGAVVYLCSQKGKGNQVKEVLGKFNNLDNYCMLDSDATYPADYIPKLVSLLVDYDVVIGARVPQNGAMSGLHKFGNGALTLLANLLFGLSDPDLCTGMWAFRGEALRKLKLTASGFELEANLYCQCAKKGLRMLAVKIPYVNRKGTRSHLRVSNGFDILAKLLKERLTL